MFTRLQRSWSITFIAIKFTLLIPCFNPVKRLSAHQPERAQHTSKGREEQGDQYEDGGEVDKKYDDGVNNETVQVSIAFVVFEFKLLIPCFDPV